MGDTVGIIGTCSGASQEWKARLLKPMPGDGTEIGRETPTSSSGPILVEVTVIAGGDTEGDPPDTKALRERKEFVETSVVVFGELGDRARGRATEVIGCVTTGNFPGTNSRRWRNEFTETAVGKLAGMEVGEGGGTSLGAVISTLLPLTTGKDGENGRNEGPPR